MHTKGRRSIRLRGFDYAQPGGYFVTICSYRKQPLFGEVVDGEVTLSTVGEIVREEWVRTEVIRKEITLDEYVIMPNHLHGIVIIETRSSGSANVRAHGHAPLRRSPRSLGSLVARFKGSVTRQVRTQRADPMFKVWQRNYFEHVIRNERELAAIRRYISENPVRWSLREGL